MTKSSRDNGSHCSCHETDPRLWPAVAGSALLLALASGTSGVARSPERPALHEVVLASETDPITDPIGFRTIKTRATDILLNANFVRLAHYPHPHGARGR
jgi:hypothetical protein